MLGGTEPRFRSCRQIATEPLARTGCSDPLQQRSGPAVGRCFVIHALDDQWNERQGRRRIPGRGKAGIGLPLVAKSRRAFVQTPPGKAGEPSAESSQSADGSRARSAHVVPHAHALLVPERDPRKAGLREQLKVSPQTSSAHMTSAGAHQVTHIGRAKPLSLGLRHRGRKQAASNRRSRKEMRFSHDRLSGVSGARRACYCRCHESHPLPHRPGPSRQITGSAMSSKSK